jgi:hypothetical protein
MKNSMILRSVFGAAMAATMACATPAMALDAKQCLPMAEMNTALKAEGQRTMIIGDREALQDAARLSDVKYQRFVNTVTSNADGSTGYQLEGDLPRVQPSTRVCVRAKLTNIHFYDPSRPTVPQAAYLGGRFDDVVRGNATRGTRPMVVADTVQRTEQGERIGLPFVMFGNAPQRSASIATRMPDGKPQFLVQMADTEYTPAGLAMFARPEP